MNDKEKELWEVTTPLCTSVACTKSALRALDALKEEGITGRSLSLAYTKLQEALMWLNKFKLNDQHKLPERHTL